MTFDNAIALLDAGAGRTVTIPGPVAGIAASAGAPILSTDGDLPDASTQHDGALAISTRDNKLYVCSQGAWYEISSAPGQ